MSRLTRWMPPLGAVGFLVLALAGTVRSDDNKPVAERHDAKSLRDSLKEVINNGAELFNKYGDHAGCYRLYQGALLSVKPFLAPTVQKEIDDAITSAEGLPRASDRAFALRKVIDTIREQAAHSPPGVVEEKTKKPETKTEAKKLETIKVVPKKVEIKKAEPKEKKAETPMTLWYRLGGEAKVQSIVADFFKTVAADPKVNVSRDGKFTLDEAGLEHAQSQLVRFLSSIGGGPLEYTGKNMKDAHRGMGITNSEYDAAGKHFKKALEKNGENPEVVAEVMKALEGLRKDIVESKKKKDAPKADAPKRDLPKTDAPKKASSKTDSPKTDAPRKDNPRLDNPGKAPPVSKVSGKVTFEGKAAPTSYITLVSEDNRRYSTVIGGDGTYAFRTALAPGQYLIAIEQAFGQKVPAIDIPRKYRNETTSGLTVDVRGWDQHFDVYLQK